VQLQKWIYAKIRQSNNGEFLDYPFTQNSIRNVMNTCHQSIQSINIVLPRTKYTSFIPDIYIAPIQETYSEALSVQLRWKINILRSLQKDDMLFWGSKVLKVPDDTAAAGTVQWHRIKQRKNYKQESK